MKNQHYTVTRDSKPQFRGSDLECFEYILKNQSFSVDYATKHGGWKINKTSLEGLIIEACLLEDGFENATIAQALENASKRFRSEYGWQINHNGLLEACKQWFQGIALQVPFWNEEIDQLGFDPKFYFEKLARAFIGLTETSETAVALCESIEAL